MAAISAFHHVALTVSNLDVSVAWYRDVFGFVELFREESEERRACVMGFAGGGHSVGLVEHRGSADERFDPTTMGLDHLAFSVATRKELDGWADALSAAGVDNSGAIDVPPGAIVNCKDPDGIALALFWDK
ncbi:MAG: VOC family protein [Acidimicrobiia bacterium]|nr:VOC family protein [Acidimicrobiia bacterium]